MQATPSQLVANLLADQRFPERWIKHHLAGRLWAKQLEILRSIRDTPRTLVPSCHGSGKTHLAARAALWFLLTHPDSIVATTAPTGRQVRKLLWQELRRAYATALRPLGGELNLVDYKVDDGWFAFGFSTDEPTGFQGLHPASGWILVIVDEASGVDPAIWEAIDGVLSSEYARLLAIGNPTDPSSRFARECKQAQLPEARVIHISAFDTPNLRAGRTVIPGLVTQQWVESVTRRYGKASPFYVSRVEGRFPEAGADTLIPLSWIEQAQHRNVEPAADAVNALGVDVAAYGGDESVIVHRHGPRFRILWRDRDRDTMDTARHAIAFYSDTGAHAIGWDANGIGAGACEWIREQNYPIAPINGGQRAFESHLYANRRAEMYWTVRQLFKDGLVDLDPADDELAAQLSSIKYKIDKQNRILIESKDDMRKRGLESPDQADAMVYAACATDVLPFGTDDAVVIG